MAKGFVYKCLWPDSRCMIFRYHSYICFCVKPADFIFFIPTKLVVLNKLSISQNSSKHSTFSIRMVVVTSAPGN